VSNNRDLIDERDIIRPAQFVEKGIPLPFMDNKFRVDQDWCGVVTEGGAFKEILEPGTHFMSRYHTRRDVRIQLVKTRRYALDVQTKDELQILKPVPAKVKLNLSVECRVTDARRVALEIDRPLVALWDRSMQAARNVFATAERLEVLTQHDVLERGILQQLQAKQLPREIGFEVFTVNVVTLEILGAGADEFAKAELQQWQHAYATVENWKLDMMMLSQSRVTPEWLMVHRPEIYQQMLAGNQAIIKELIDKGLFDPAGALLTQPAGAPTADPRQMFGNLGMGGLLGGPAGYGAPGANPQPGPYGQPAPTLAAAPQIGSGDPLARIRQEVEYLRSLPGAQARAAAGEDESGLPDGSFLVDVAVPRPSGGMLKVCFLCPRGYPQQPPEMELELDDQVTSFQSAKAARWQPQIYLVELVREAQQRFG
jgi:hypothetical protein